jgi:hypothetical protein
VDAELHHPDTCTLTVAIENVSALPVLTGQQRRSGYKHCPNFPSITRQKEIYDYKEHKEE